MNIDNIGLIVDGPTEQGALEKMFDRQYQKKTKIRYSNGNGTNYNVDTYAEKVTPTIIMLLKGCTYSIVLIPDLERREKKGKTTLSEFAKDIKNAIIQKIIQKGVFKEEDLEQKIFVCPSNIMFENWIISDVEGIKKSGKIKNDSKQDFFDGTNGATQLAKMMTVPKYKKTIHANGLFQYVDWQSGKNNSPSFSTFLCELENLLG